MAKPCFIGIEIGGTKLQIVVGDAVGNITGRQRFTVDQARGAEAIRAQIAGAVPGLAADATAIGIGVVGLKFLVALFKVSYK